MAASGVFLMSSGMLDRSPYAMINGFFEIVKKQCLNLPEDQRGSLHCWNGADVAVESVPTLMMTMTPSSTATSLGSFVALTLFASLMVMAAIAWIGVSHQHPTTTTTTTTTPEGEEEAQAKQQRTARRSVLLAKMKHRKIQNKAARCIQTLWRNKRSAFIMMMERERVLSTPTMLSLFGGNDPYVVAAGMMMSTHKKTPMHHIQYSHRMNNNDGDDDDESSTESSSLPDLIDHKASAGKHSFRRILMGLTLVVLLSRCITTEDPWTHVPIHHFGMKKTKGLPTTTEKNVPVTREIKKKGSFDCDCNSYAQTLGGAYGPFVPFS